MFIERINLSMIEISLTIVVGRINRNSKYPIIYNNKNKQSNKKNLNC